MIVAGLGLAVAALYALLTLQQKPPDEAIDEASRARLEAVLRDTQE